MAQIIHNDAWAGIATVPRTFGNDGLGGRKRAERKAGEDKGEYGTFRGSFLSALD